MGDRNRAGVKARVYDLFTHWLDADETVAVVYSRNQDTGEADTLVFLGNVTGDKEAQSFGVEPLEDDRFTIQAEIIKFWSPSDEGDAELDAEADCEAFLILLENGLRGLTNLQDPAVDDRGSPPPYRGVKNPRIGRVEGPFHAPTDETGLFATFIDFDIDCVTYIH